MNLSNAKCLYGVVFLIVSAAFFTARSSAYADFLYWTDDALQTRSLNIGYGIAEQALRAEGAGGIRRQQIEVSGSVGRNYVAIHCVPTSPRVRAIIMVIGPDAAETAKVRESVRRRMTSARPID